ncbi:MAG: NfeD family protein [Gaiellaceae bacterium]
MLLVLAVVAALFWLPTGWGIAAIVGGAAVELAEIAGWVWLSRRRRPVTGVEALAGRVGAAVSACAPRGQVRVDGELWNARSEPPAAAGEQVVVVEVEDGLTLVVRPISAPAPE